MAGFSVKSHTEKLFGRGNRLVYNAIACIHLALVLYCGSWWLGTNLFGAFSDSFTMICMKTIRGIGLLLVLFSLSRYDLGEFVGVKQLDGKMEDVPLNKGGLNGWVRHPMYLGILLFVWGGATSELGFYTAVFVTGYLLIGIRFEEKKLVRVFGDEYIEYQREVSMLFPLKKMFSK